MASEQLHEGHHRGQDPGHLLYIGEWKEFGTRGYGDVSILISRRHHAGWLIPPSEERDVTFPDSVCSMTPPQTTRLQGRKGHRGPHAEKRAGVGDEVALGVVVKLLRLCQVLDGLKIPIEYLPHVRAAAMSRGLRET